MESMTRDEQEVSLDVVLPLYNEEEVIDALIDRLGEVFAPDRLRGARIRSIRYVFVDDGSRDHTAQRVAARIEAGVPGVLVRLSRNFGHQNALTAGLDICEADVVAVMDGDLQDPPDVVPKMLESWRQGADIVCGVRARRVGNPLKVFCYWLFYRLLAYLSEVDIPLDSGDFSLVDRKVVAAMRSLPERLRFHRGLRAWVGFRHALVPYERPDRPLGRSKYSFRKLYILATDGIASSSIRPLRVTQLFCLVFALLSLAFSATLAGRLAFDPSLDGEPVRFLVLCLLISASGFMIVFSLYVLGAYVGRTYLEVKGRPPYIIREIVGREPYGK